MAYAAPVSATLTSLFGKTFGVDRTKSQRPYALNDFRTPVTLITTGSTNVTNNGLASVSSSSGAWTMDPPEPGVVKRFFATSTSTVSRTFALSAGNFEVGAQNVGTVTAGSSYVVITLNGQGQSVECVGISTAKFVVTNLAGFSTAATIFSTV